MILFFIFLTQEFFCHTFNTNPTLDETQSEE